MPRGALHQLRPGHAIAGPPIASARIGRQQLVVEPRGEDAVHVRSIGPARVRIAGKAVTDAVARTGDVIEIHNAAVFLVTSRAGQAASTTSLEFAYGAADPFGMIGESELA